MLALALAKDLDSPAAGTTDAVEDGEAEPVRLDGTASRIGEPLALGTFGGFFHRGSERARAAVLLLSPFGYEELCVRASWRILAETIAATGLPCLRFDYPGTGDAIDPAVIPPGLADWRAAVHTAAAALREASGCRHLVVVGQGLGAALAAELAAELDPVVGTVLMAPVVSGRSYLREMKAWAKVMADSIGSTPEAADVEGYVVAGFPLTAARVAGVQAIDLTKLDRAPGAAILLVSRPQAAVPKALAERLEAIGASVTRLSYDGYDAMMTDPTQAETPAATFDAVVAWMGDRIAELPPRPALRLAPLPSRDMTLAGEGFEETPMSFADGRLFGVLCRPLGPGPTPVVLFASAGRDYHVGWGRSTVTLARALAAAGVASFRFDMRGSGDSPRDGGTPDEMLYAPQQIEDVRSAIDQCEALGYATVTLFGRCSGAWAAFNAAAVDARVGRLVLVNIARFVWTPGESVAEAMKFAQRSIGDLGTTLLSREGLRRLFAGKLRVRAAGVFVVKRLATKVGGLFAFVPGKLTMQSKLYYEVHGHFRVLRERNVPVTLVYAAGDGTRNELGTYMGRKERRVSNYRNVDLIEVPGADHNFTHRSAQNRLAGHILGALAAGER